MIQPYYEDGLVTLYHGDCRLVEVPACDVTIADPPYGETSLEWDRWPVGWVYSVRGSSMWCFGSMRMFLEHKSDFDAWRLAQDVVWEKQNGSGFSSDRFKRVHECVLHFYRGEWESIYRVPPKVSWSGPRKTVRKRGQTPHTGEIGVGAYVDDGSRLMTSVLYARNCQGYAEHPTQKPAGILAPLISYSAPVGGTVYVPFAGVGSELDTARQLGRRAIGVEINERYCEIAARRLSSALPLSFDAVDPHVGGTTE